MVSYWLDLWLIQVLALLWLEPRLLVLLLVLCPLVPLMLQLLFVVQQSPPHSTKLDRIIYVFTNAIISTNIFNTSVSTTTTLHLLECYQNTHASHHHHHQSSFAPPSRSKNPFTINFRPTRPTTPSSRPPLLYRVPQKLPHLHHRPVMPRDHSACRVKDRLKTSLNPRATEAGTP